MPADSAKNATPEMVTMPAGQAESGPRKPVFHPGLGVEGVILPPQITSEPKQSALSAAEASAGAKAVGEAPTAGARKKFSYTERRSAEDILQRHHNNAGSNLSADWLRKVEWAKSVIPDWQQSSRALAQAKRQRSQEAPAPSAKKSRVQAGKSFAQIARERILIGVLDRGNQDGRIPRNQWRWVESALATQCLQLLEKEPGPPPICKDVGWYQGNVKVIACDDNRSAELYKAAVSNLGEVYPGAKVAAVDWEEVPVKPRARMWFPSTIKEPEQLLRMLQRCNPSLPTPGPTHQAVIILNKESLAPIDAAGGELNFGFSSVFIRVYKSDAAVGDALPDKPVEEDIVAELEAPERPDMEAYTSDASSLTRDLKKLWQAGDLEVTSDLASDLASDEEDANITAASAALLLRLAGGGADIVLIQEPWVVGGKVSGLGSADYKLFVANAQAVSLELRPAPIRLLSSYMAYDQEGPIPEDITRSLVSDCASNKIGLIIGCDANAHHTQWGSSNVNTRESAPEGPHSTRRLLNLINIFTDACTSACKASCPVVKPRGRKKLPWWNHNLNELRKKSRTLFNQAKESDLNEAWLNYKRQLAVYKKEIRRAKRHSWRAFCSDIESTSEAARLRKILSKSSPSLGYIRNDNDTWTTSSEESLETLLTKHFPGCSQHSLCSRQVLNEVPLNPSLFSPNNIAWAINSFKPFKSPGPDGIAPAHLQHAGNTAINWLQSIFTGIFRTGQIPEPWKNSKVVFIPKAGKASHITAKDFRPISLTSFLLKTFERILSLHLRAIIPCDLISNSQHAYRKGRSTETALHSVTATIEKSISLKEFTLIAFLDIEGAFNNVFPDAIAEALTDLGIEGRLVGLINQLLTSRAVTSTLGSSTLTRDEWTSATPGQEGALSFYTDGSKLDNQNSLVGRVARQSWPHIDKARSNALCNLSRRDCSLVIRSLTGHWLIGIHAQRLNSPYNDFCRSCRDEEEEESPEHFFCFCPALSSRRFRFLGKPFLDGLGDLASLSPRKIAQFVQSSNWTPF
ncbi:hypothetical protein ACLKA6_010413 [Drosophila palustris]